MRLAAGLDLTPGVGGTSIPGGPSDIVEDIRRGLDGAGVVGADETSGGTRFERTRIGGFGPAFAFAVAGRAGGGGPGEGVVGERAADIPGDAV